MKFRDLVGGARRSARAAIAAIVGLSIAQTHAQETYCNPLDIDYKYNFEEKWRNISYRSGADPVIVNHNGQFFLFGTIADGFWRSDNLVVWEHIKPDGWPEREIVAPAALSAKGKLFLFPST